MISSVSRSSTFNLTILTKTGSRGSGKGRTNMIDLQCEMALLEDAIWS
ncbi:MAG: hypothetical protein K8E24_000175 [Methanobacterium paludis]|nr:hypothetical protein [Methanobacterium paludis]